MNEVDALLARLRRLGRNHSLDATSSWQFSLAADSLTALRRAMMFGHTPPSEDRRVTKRVQHLKEGVLLQRSLEIDHGIAHKRSLKEMVKLADHSEHFTQSDIFMMEAIAHKSNSARHMKWESRSGAGVVDSPCVIGCVKSHLHVQAEIMLSRLEQLVAELPIMPPVPRRPPGKFVVPHKLDSDKLVSQDIGSACAIVDHSVCCIDVASLVFDVGDGDLCCPRDDLPRRPGAYDDEDLAIAKVVNVGRVSDKKTDVRSGSSKAQSLAGETTDVDSSYSNNPFMQLDILFTSQKSNTKGGSTNSPFVKEKHETGIPVSPAKDSPADAAGAELSVEPASLKPPRFKRGQMVVTMKSVGDFVGDVVKTKWSNPTHQWAYLVDVDDRQMWFLQTQLQDLDRHAENENDRHSCHG